MMNPDIAATFARHHRIGFQFSGGRDSTAALYLLRPLWSRMTVYHLDTGDQFPETRRVVQAVARDVPIVMIHGDSKAVREQFGLPSDLVPVDSTDLGRACTGEAVRIVSKFECCARSLMLPMHQRMLDDGISLIVRGQRADEFAQAPTRSGDRDEHVELLFPIEDWTAAQVDAYIREHDLPVAPFYAEGMNETPECMGCTGWWRDGRLQYLRRYYPHEYAEVRRTISIVRAAIDRQYATLNDEE
jgi:phosphoadenosine phosphosulfate reductase